MFSRQLPCLSEGAISSPPLRAYLGRWLSRPIGDTPMLKINLAYFFMLGELAGRVQSTCIRMISKPLDHVGWLEILDASNCIKPHDVAVVLPRTARIAK